MGINQIKLIVYKPFWSTQAGGADVASAQNDIEVYNKT